MTEVAETLDLALRHHLAGELAEAEALYREVLASDPGHADALHRLGLVAQATGRKELAVSLIEQAIASNPAAPEYRNSLGITLRDCGFPDKAVASYTQAIALRPGYAEAHSNLSVALCELDRLEAAAAHGRTAAGLKPDYAELHMNLAHILTRQGLLGEASAACSRALALQPESPDIWNAMGNVLRKQGRAADAERHYRHALSLRPSHADALSNLGLTLQEQGLHGDAVAFYRQALELKPALAETHFNLGNALRALGRWDEATAAFRQALAIQRQFAQAENQLMHHLQQLCDWRGLEEIVERQRRCVSEHPGALIAPFTLLSIPSTPAEQLACARNLVANRFAPLPRTRSALGFRHEARPKPRLRIGYLSEDFHQHVTAFLVADLFELHDRNRFEVFAYSFGPDDGSAIRRRLIAASDRFVEVGALPYEDCARRIHADGVDVLVDLKGYTTGARTEIVALRPAPVQVSFLGYPGTMGADFIDYIVTDKFVTPPDQARHFSEKLVYLPDCYRIEPGKRWIAARTPAREELELPERGFVFCCHNNSYKITSTMFALWLRLLAAVPGSVLWLLESNDAMAANLRREALERGADPGRLVFAPRAPIDLHHARLRAADLFLDSFPYNAHTTASDALWVGLPVLTCAGETFASRVGGSVLIAAGLRELVTESLAEYEATALRLAQNASELGALRARLVANRAASPLFDSARFTSHLEQAFETMWQKLVEGREPEAIEVSATANKDCSGR